jgi:hypothetical protein
MAAKDIFYWSVEMDFVEDHQLFFSEMVEFPNYEDVRGTD